MSQHYQPVEAPADGHIVVGQVAYDDGTLADVWRTPDGQLYEVPEFLAEPEEPAEEALAAQVPAPAKVPYRGFRTELGESLRDMPWWGWVLYAAALVLAGWYVYWGATSHWGFWGNWGYLGFALIFGAIIAFVPLMFVADALPKAWGYALAGVAALAWLGAAGWFAWWSWHGFGQWWSDSSGWGKFGFIAIVMALALGMLITAAPELGPWVLPLLLLVIVPPIALIALAVFFTWSSVGRTLEAST